jgi:hypothetical protein
MDTVNRSVTLDVFCPIPEEDTPRNQQDHFQVINAVRKYRACARQMFAIGMLSMSAGSKIEIHDDDIRVATEKGRSAEILQALFGKGGKGMLYSMRQWFLGPERRTCKFPTEVPVSESEAQWSSAESFVWDSCRRDVVNRWNSKDPEFTKASRGWLTLQGARGMARFNNIGIGFPVLTAKPKMTNHTIRLKWDRAVGEIEFKIKRLDHGRWETWKSIVSGEYSAGTLFLNERKGELRITVAYQKPAASPDLIIGKTLQVEFLSDRICMSSRGDTDEVMTTHAVGALGRFEMRKKAIEARREACGSVFQAWGHRNGWHKDQDVLSNLTRVRSAFLTDQNHAWSRRIADRVRQWRCGKVNVVLPEDLSGRTWPWHQFKEFMTYKISELGGVVEFESMGPPSDPETAKSPSNGQVTTSTRGGVKFVPSQ